MLPKKKRFSKDQALKNISESILDHKYKHICIKCYETLQQGNVPHLALANGLWIGEVPDQLKNLSWTEQLLISKVIQNKCVVRVSKSRMHKMTVNVICQAVPMSKIYSVLPPKRENLDDVLAFLYLGPIKPTPEDYKRTPLLIR